MMHGKMCPVHKVAYALVLLGALNWGLIGLAGFNLLDALLSSAPTLERAAYVLVGLSALAMLFKSKCGKCCGECKEDHGSAGGSAPTQGGM